MLYNFTLNAVTDEQSEQNIRKIEKSYLQFLLGKTKKKHIKIINLQINGRFFFFFDSIELNSLSAVVV